MNRVLRLALVVASLPAVVLLVPSSVRAQSLDAAMDAAAVDAGTPGEIATTVVPDPSATADAGEGCANLPVNAPCTLAGAAGFCFANPVDGSESDLECVTDGSNPSEGDGCDIAGGASSAGTIGGGSALLALGLGVAVSKRRRRNRPDTPSDD